MGAEEHTCHGITDATHCRPGLWGQSMAREKLTFLDQRWEILEPGRKKKWRARKNSSLWDIGHPRPPSARWPHYRTTLRKLRWELNEALQRKSSGQDTALKQTLNHYYHNNPITLWRLFKQKCFPPVLPPLNPSSWSTVKDLVVVVLVWVFKSLQTQITLHLSRRQKASAFSPLAEVSCALGRHQRHHPLKAFGLQALLQN